MRDCPPRSGPSCARSSRPSTGRSERRCCRGTDIDFLDASQLISQAAGLAWVHAHTRYPVTADGSSDKVIGVVHTRNRLDPALAGRLVVVRELTTPPAGP